MVFPWFFHGVSKCFHGFSKFVPGFPVLSQQICTMVKPWCLVTFKSRKQWLVWYFLGCWTSSWECRYPKWRSMCFRMKPGWNLSMFIQSFSMMFTFPWKYTNICDFPAIHVFDYLMSPLFIGPILNVGLQSWVIGYRRKGESISHGLWIGWLYQRALRKSELVGVHCLFICIQHIHEASSVWMEVPTFTVNHLHRTPLMNNGWITKITWNTEN